MQVRQNKKILLIMNLRRGKKNHFPVEVQTYCPTDAPGGHKIYDIGLTENSYSSNVEHSLPWNRLKYNKLCLHCNLLFPSVSKILCFTDF